MGYAYLNRASQSQTKPGSPSKRPFSRRSNPGNEHGVFRSVASGPRVEVGSSNNAHESEASAVADAVVVEGATGSARAQTSGETLTTSKLINRAQRLPDQPGTRGAVADVLGSSEAPSVEYYSGSAVDDAAKSLHADAFSWRNQVYLSSNPVRHTRDWLSAHETAHVFQNPRDNVLRRAMAIQGDAWFMSRRRIDDRGAEVSGDGLGPEFMAGAEKYLGISLTKSWNSLTGKYDLSETNTSSSKTRIDERRQQVKKSFTPALVIPQTIVTAKDKIETFEVKIDDNYAEGVFDVAVEIVRDALGQGAGQLGLDVQVNTSKDSSMWEDTRVRIFLGSGKSQ